MDIVYKPFIKVVGIEIRTINEEGKFDVDIPKHWEKFHKENWAKKIPNKISNEIFAVYTNYEEDYQKPYSLIIGSFVSSFEAISSPLVSCEILPAKYGLFPVKGPMPDSLIETWQSIWKSDLKRSYRADFERYFGDQVEVYISIED